MAGSKDENKVFDVAKPGESKPETGSKPMVVGHKLMGSDPTLTSSDNGPEQTNYDDSKLVSKPKLKISPITAVDDSEVPKPEDKSAENKSEVDDEKKDSKKEQETILDAETEPTKKQDNTITPIEKTAEEEKTDAEDKEKSEQKEATKEELQTEEDNIQLERENKLHEIIKSKEYNVPIGNSSSSSFRIFFITFLSVCLLGVIIMTILIDAEIVDLGIKLPFNLL